MYLAELHGKLSRSVENQEDILTSNVFSFFKYSRRDIFLKNYLETVLKIQFSLEDVINAEFLFWPTYNDNTEPDLVIIVGNYYLLFEAKYFSDFGKESSTKKDQITREIEGGYLEAMQLNKEFIYIAITADSVYRQEKFPPSIRSLPGKFKWTNWQTASSLIERLIFENFDLQSHEYWHALDLHSLLDKKNLRSFSGFKLNGNIDHFGQIFFDSRTSKYRGYFIGFMNSLSTVKKIAKVPSKIYHYNSDFRLSKRFFGDLKDNFFEISNHETLFFNRRVK